MSNVVQNPLRRLGLILLIVGLAACTPATPAPVKTEALQVKIVYPTVTSKAEMGQNLKCIIEVLDGAGKRVTDAQVTLSVIDTSGQEVGQVAATAGSADLYRTSAWPIPHKLKPGTWTVRAEARTETGRGSASSAFQVKNSVSEYLLGKYGFWVEAPTLRGIKPDIGKERGDAQNGVVIWGGVLPSQHIFPENWLEVHWRTGDFHLATAEQVRDFVLNTLGDVGFTPLRGIGPFEKTRFKDWDAWQAKARGQYSRYDWQWLVFYAPEAGKTYAISTMVVQAPTGIDAHATLRDAFEVHPEWATSGAAPEPLLQLLPPPLLVSPELGQRVMGNAEPITLRWKPVKELAPDEYYRVHVDYNYSETNTTVDLTTRETEVTLPASLYDQPNCGVFNWHVTLMKQIGVDRDGLPKGKELSYKSLYWYVEWLHPTGEDMPFTPRCPNPQT